MAQRPVLETEEVGFEPVSDYELDVGVAYARKEYAKDVDRDMLRVLVNTTLERRSPKTILPFLAATVVREAIPLKDKERAPKIEAYKGAVMKILSDRSVQKRGADARKRAAGREVPPKPKPTEHPEDPKHKGQFLLL
ncbi:hypothetical protein HYW60_00380 [Candidatus Kaiserbacteria bacterium]|nr:hypothetical protein [Candidatus Kaiserbacteria bacterium]